MRRRILRTVALLSVCFALAFGGLVACGTDAALDKAFGDRIALLEDSKAEVQRRLNLGEISAAEAMNALDAITAGQANLRNDLAVAKAAAIEDTIRKTAGTVAAGASIVSPVVDSFLPGAGMVLGILASLAGSLKTKGGTA